MQGHWSYFCTLPTATLYSITTEYILAGEKFWKLTWKRIFCRIHHCMIICLHDRSTSFYWLPYAKCDMDKFDANYWLLEFKIIIYIYLYTQNPLGSTKPHLSWPQVFLILLPQFGIFPRNCETEVWSEGNKKEFNEK